MSLGTIELLIVVGVVLFLFGAPFLTRLSRNLGKNVGAYRQGLDEGDRGTEAAVRIERIPDDESDTAEEGPRPPCEVPPGA